MDSVDRADKAPHVRAGYNRLVETKNKLGFFTNLLVWFLLLSLLPLITVSYFNYQNTYKALVNKTKYNLAIIAQNNVHEIQHYFRESLTDLLVEVRSKIAVAMLNDFKSAFRAMGPDLKAFVKSPQWTALDQKYGKHIEFFTTSHGYDDFLIIDAKGDLLYTLKQERDLGTNLFNGPYADTFLGKACRKAFEQEMPVFSDFERYAPSFNTPAAFLITLMFDEEGEKIGLAAVQVGNVGIDRIMKKEIGLGASAESYLIGSDLIMRSNSVLDDKPTILSEMVTTDQTRRWLHDHIEHETPEMGRSYAQEVSTYIGRKGYPVIGMYGNVEIGGVRMAVITEVKRSEAIQAATALRELNIVLLLVTMAIATGLAFMAARRITLPVKRLSDWAGRVAAGVLAYEAIPAPNNEIGHMNDSFRQVVDSFKSVSDVCEAIAKGDFSKSVTVRSDGDVLGRSVNTMGRRLKAAHADAARKISYLNNIPALVHVIDKDFNLLFINDTGAKIINKDAADCIGKKCYQLLNTGHCNTPACCAVKAMRSEKVLSADTVANIEGLDRLPIRYTSAPLKDDAGNITGSIGYVLDISDEMTVVDLAERISRGDYTVEIERRSQDDRLSASLNRMTRNLREMTRENERQNWLKTGQTQLNDRMRGEPEMAALGSSLITFLARYLKAQIGAFYVPDGNNRLHLIAGYAYKKHKQRSNAFELGEGLVGQAALEKQRIILANVPDDYIAVSSGLGAARPCNIVVVPVVFDGEVKGVIELGSLYAFADDDLVFLDLVAENIAIAIHSAQSRLRVQELLEETQTQAEELQAQQEELRQANEELEEQTEALTESEARLQAQQEELQQTNEELEEQARILEEQKSDIKIKNTELEKTGKLLEEKAKDLEITNRYKSEFLANMSHELRTPLNSILLLSKLLWANKEKTLTQKQVEYAQTVYGSGNELITLINEILDLSRVESGKMELHIEDVKLQNVVIAMKRHFNPVANQKQLRFDIQTAADLPSILRTDQQRLEQIIKNLLSNAFKFTSQGNVCLKIGRPDKNAALLRDGLAPDRVVAFSVSDTGVGVPAEKLKLIFEAFAQADGSTMRQYGGTGLGLSISRELARLLGGEIQVDSIEGRGATFVLYLPETFGAAQEPINLQAEKPAASANGEKPEMAGADQAASRDTARASGPDAANEFIPDDRKAISALDRSILIIEDDPTFARLLRDISREKDYKTIVARSGESGLHFADFYQPSGIILDVGLPGMDGWTVMIRLKENPNTRHIPVHFISAANGGHDALRMGAVGHLTKPVSMESLEQVFQKIDHIISKPDKNLLVVEDDKTQQKAIAELIGNNDVHTTLASTSEEAYALLTSKPFDCMVLDLGLPDMSGLDLLKKIRNTNHLIHLPIIVYTGRELTAKEKARIEEYAQRIIVKNADSIERLLDETALFLHRVEADLPEAKRKMLRMIHDNESILHGKRILVADDDIRNVFALTSILEQRGVQVIANKNGREALEKLKKHPDIDLILMDIMMPEMDGYTAMRSIRNSEADFRDLPIIALTAKAMKDDRSKCIAAGANDYLAKPVDADKLLSMLRVWLY
jgi:CheY-like chemotaxis protein/HAMP domain-containing protein